MSNITDNLCDWTSGIAELQAGLRSRMPNDDSRVPLPSFQGLELGAPSNPWFDGVSWARFTSDHWEIPFIAVTGYFLTIAIVQWVVERYGKWNVRNFAFCWNVGLSLFSLCGLVACLPVLVTSVIQKSLYFTVCAPPLWYGNNWSGLFVMLFVYSKIAELLETVMVLLEKKPVIAVQWLRHSLVLLYYWHLYSVYSATCIWFAGISYCVEGIVYGYSALTLTRYRNFVTPSAIFITLAILIQMLVGMYVSIKAVYHQTRGNECHVNKSNAMLGLVICFICFVLVFKLLCDNYWLKDREKSSALPKSQSFSLAAVRKASQKSLDDITPYARRPFFVDDECLPFSRSASSLVHTLRNISEKALDGMSSHTDDDEDDE